ncbi:MAG: prohibitin family protein [Oscillospiraceae bacterium]|jgi:regulator of protease activity HflC (stomatin/prohibitin superfamily)|nr:prohibitin family protein [Oscillospiraceae bacterium]
MNPKQMSPKRRFKIIILPAILVIAALILVFNSAVIINSGTVGVVSVLGAVQDAPMGGGFHFKAPFVTTVVKIDVQTQKIEVTATAASKDLQTVSVIAAVNYHIDPSAAPELYKTVGMSYEMRIIAPAVQESIKAVVAKFSAEQLITQRQIVSNEIKTELAQKVVTYHIITDEFNITNFDFSEEFNRAVEAKQTAQQNALKAEQELAKIKIDAQQQVEQAKAEADALRATADAEAYAIKAKADAESYAIEAIQKMLRESPQSYLEYQKTQKWDGKLPVVGAGAGTYLDINSLLN